ncbi:MAG: hypothetical protein ABJL44_11325 [Algibacter sp.]
MKFKKNKTLKWFYFSVGGIIMFIISFTLIYDLLIPDICYYHMNEMNSFMSLFYSAGGVDNGHPSPNLLNFLFSLFIGGVLGNGIYMIVAKK